MVSPLPLPPLGDFAYQAEQLLAIESKMSQILLVRDESGRPLIFKIAATAALSRCSANRQAIHNSVRWLERIPPHPALAGLQPIVRKPNQTPSRQPPTGAGPISTQQATHLATLQEWPGAPEFVVMDYLPGGTLSAFVRRTPLPAKVALWLTYRLAQALAHLHAHGCVHRDLKPENILFKQAPQQVKSLQALQPVLIDFGIAAGAGENKLVCGSRQWMAPELQVAYTRQLLAVDPAWDIYALGLISCYMLSGLRPPPNGTAAQDYQDYQARVFAVFAAPSAAHEESLTIGMQLKQLLQQMLAEQPAARPTATMLITAIKTLLTTVDDAKILSTPVGPAPLLEPASPRTSTFPVVGWVATRVNRYTIGSLVAGLLLLLVLARYNGDSEQIVNAAAAVQIAAKSAEKAVATSQQIVAVVSTPKSTPKRMLTATGQGQFFVDPAPTLAALPTIERTTSVNLEPIPTLAAIELISAALPTLAPLPPTATPTSRPSSTSLPTRTATQPPTAAPTDRPVALPSLRLQLLAPAAAEVSSTPRVAFTWETVGAAATAEQCFELVFWDGQNPSDKRSPVGASPERQRTVNFAALCDSRDPLLQRLARSADGFDWGVRIVDCANPHTILQDASDSRHYTYRP